MLDFSQIRNLYKSTDRINSQHQVIAEWNMNKYIPIKEYGVYRGFPGTNQPGFGVSNIYNASSSVSDIFGGQNYLVYDDGSKQVDPSQEYFSDLASVFKPDRPDPGIILLQNFGNMTFAPSSDNIKVASMTTSSARYYPGSKNRLYDYFNSAKLMDLIPVAAGEQNFNLYSQASYGISDAVSGKIAHANPFVVYETASGVPCNKITIKVQNHLSIPVKFYVDILTNSSSWSTVYSSSSTIDFSNGILNLYYNAGTWSKTVSRVDDINQLTAVNPTELQKINGVRFKVEQLSLVKSDAEPLVVTYSPGSLELIEISPRLEIDLSAYTESFNFDSSIGDSTSFGLPVGSIVTGAGAVSLSNEDNQFLISSTLSSLKMLNQDVKFSFYQKVYTPSASQTLTVPMKVLYSNEWNVGEDYSVSINLEDGMKFLRETNAPDILFSSNAALSSIILILLDNVGITGMEFKKSSDEISYDKEDTRIKNFFCKKEQTVAEVLEQIALATQCSMFYDAVGRLNVLTKEKLTENATIEDSSQIIILNPDRYKYVWYNNNWFFYGGNTDALPSETEWTYSDYYGFWVSEDHPVPAQSPGTDFWFLGDEDYSVADPEYSYINGYKANIASLSEQKISPLTDGEITYHTYGPRKSALVDSLQKEKSKVLEQLNIDEVPMASLAFSNYGYTSTILWSAGDNNESALGASNLVRDIPLQRLKTAFPGTYVAVDENDLITQLYNTSANDDLDRRSLIIYLDTNEGLTLDPFEGIVLIDNEYIRYRGKLYYIASTSSNLSRYQIIFTKDDFNQLKSTMRKGDSLSFRGLVIDVKTQIVGKSDDKYQYKVIGDGRAALKSKPGTHFALAEDSDGIEDSNRFKLMLGGSLSESRSMPGNLKATTKFNFLDKVRYKSARKNLGTIPSESLQSYLGFLHLSGPTSPKEDTDILLSILDSNRNKNVARRLQELNKQVDKDVPGESFDDYVFMQGERNIYGQRITLDFQPNAISTRMRLYSPRRQIKNQQDIMSTNSSIAGIGFGLNNDNEGYFLEVESAGSGKNVVEKNAWKYNLRFYKISLKSQDNGKTEYEPELLLRAGVAGFTVFDTSIEVIKNDDVPTDPVFELDIIINKYENGMEYSIFYGGQKIGSYTEPIGKAVGVNSRDIFLFVRNDSQAIYEYVMAAARPYSGVISKNNEKDWLKNYKYFNNQLEKGIIPVNKNFLFKDSDKGIQFYFNDFARLAREVKEYNVRFSAPAYVSALLDISKINPKYFIKNYESTSFGAKLTLVNSSGGPITLGDSSDLPIYIVGISAEEINTGAVNMKDYYDMTQDDKKRVTEREKNISIYGAQSFTLDSQYIQSISHARDLMRWISKHCNRPRIKLSIETFANPIIELGDKVRIFDKSRGYNESNTKFGPKTFVISSISHSVSPAGPSTNIDLIEVGES